MKKAIGGSGPTPCRILFYSAAILTTPQVPQYNPEAIEAPRPLAAPRASAPGAEAFGSGLGQGLQNVGKIGLEIAKDERDKAVRTMTIEGRTKVDQAEVDLLYDPKEGALTKKGKEAFSIVDPTLKAYDERVAEIAKNTPAEDARLALMLAAKQRRVEVEKQLQRHVSGEMTGYAKETVKASLESTINNISMQYQDPERVEQERKFGLGVIMSDPENKGLPPEAVKMKVATWDSIVHKSVIDRMMIDNPVAAQEYFQTNRDKILAADAVKIEHALKPLAAKQEGMGTALQLARAFDGASDPATLQRMEADAMKEARSRLEKNPDALNVAEVQIGQMARERVALIKAEKDQAAAPIYTRLAQIRLNHGIPKLSDIPSSEWTALVLKDPEEAGKIQLALRGENEHAVDRARAEQDRRETKATLESLTTWGMLKGNPEILRVTNLDKLLGSGKITKSHYQDLVGDQLAIKQGKGEHEAKLLSDKAAVDIVLKAVSIDSKKDPERYGKFYDELNSRMKVFEAENSRKPKQDEVKNMARGLLGEVSQDVNFWPIDKTVKAFEADPGKIRVPAAERKKIEAKLKTRGLPVTDERIANIYLEAQKRGGK